MQLPLCFVACCVNYACVASVHYKLFAHPNTSFLLIYIVAALEKVSVINLAKGEGMNKKVLATEQVYLKVSV